jgi:effector-binding domain-containing protein
MTTVGEPHVEERAAQAYVGIRMRAPMRGLSGVTDRLRKELAAWLARENVPTCGPMFRRFYVIDMAGEMDIEVGVPVAATALPNVTHGGRVRACVLPAGRYASLTYSGSGLAGNKALIEWARAQGLAWDRWDDPKGDAFACRIESYLTDPKTEPRKTKWQIEVAIKLRAE